MMSATGGDVRNEMAEQTRGREVKEHRGAQRGTCERLKVKEEG